MFMKQRGKWAGDCRFGDSEWLSMDVTSDTINIASRPRSTWRLNMCAWMTHRHEYGWSGTTEEGAAVWLHVSLALYGATLTEKRVEKVGHRSIRCKWWVIWVRKQVFPLETVGLRPNIEIWKVNPPFKRPERRTKLLRQRDELKAQNVQLNFHFNPRSSPWGNGARTRALTLCRCNLSHNQPIMTLLHLIVRQ